MTSFQISRALIQLNQDLEEILVVEESIVKSKLKSNPLASFVLSFIMKANNLLKGITLLHKNRVNESTEIISKSLLELNVTFLYFLKLYTANPSDVCQRFLDCIMLEIIEMIRKKKAAKSHREELANSMKNMLFFEQSIRIRYNREEFKKLKTFGFSGKQISDMVETLDIHNEWERLTKEFPVNVHSNHFYPLFNYERNTRSLDFIKSRHLDSMHVACLSAGCIASSANEVIDCGLEERITVIQKNLTSLRSIGNIFHN